MLLTAGEFPIIIYSDIARTEELKRKGAPIEWVKAEPHITYWFPRQSRARLVIPPPLGCS